ncbi:hypothetical protein C0993_002652 [Termitomyces sp. T159_Od127]|nr:hypothetical protein C0993_002652 [Termitomyces sp. T159_Od127]
MMLTSSLNFCLPCSPSSAAKNITKDLPSDSTSDWGFTPTPTEYAGRTARDFLSILDAIAQTVPVPGFAPAVKVAVSVMNTCNEYRAFLDGAMRLKNRIQGVLIIVVDELKGTNKEEDIRAELIHDINILKGEMEYIKVKLDKITSQHRFLLLLFRGINNDKVDECAARLNNAMEKFTLRRTMDNAHMFAQLEQQITAFYNEKKVFHSDQKEDLKILQLGIDDVKAILNQRLPEVAVLSPFFRAPIPANSTIFYGRDHLVSELVSVIIAAPRKNICLLGPGGMGKTSVSLAVMGHQDIKSHFAEHLHVWVPCIKATSASLFLGTLQSSLAIPKEIGDIRSSIISVLQESPPIVILLDNFETPWDADRAQIEIAQLLRDIHAIPHVTLFITMRSSVPPCNDLPWYQVDLHGVDAVAAQEIYTAVYPKSFKDPDLPLLLELIGHMPLAITLMAKVAKVAPLSAAELIKEYDRLGTSMLGQGSDAMSSMDVCIGLSVNSSHMKAHPEAFDLLCVLSMLPTGTSYKMLSKWWAKNMSNLLGALDILKGTSLLEEKDSTSFVLPVIQCYVTSPT